MEKAIKTLGIFLLCAMVASTKAQTTSHMIDEVVITGTNNATGRDLLPYTVTTVTNKEIEASGKTQLLSALSGRVPGLFVTERNILGFGVSNGGAGGIKIRGIGGSPTNAVLMMVDGQPSYAGIFSHHVADFYETEHVDHVEVLRGPGSVLYGSNAMGGVINVITKEAEQQGIHTTAKSEYGSYNTWCSSLTSMARYGKFSAMLSAAYDRTDGIQNNFDFSQKSIYAKTGYDIDKRWKLRADYSLMETIGNDPVYAKLSNPDATYIYHQNIIRGEASASLANRHTATNGNLRIYYNYGNHYVDDPNHFNSLDDRFGIIAYQNISLWQGANTTVGFDFDTYTGKIPVSGGKEHTEGSLSTIERKSITEYSPYLTFSQSINDGFVTLNGGLRMANSDRFGTQWVPQCGIIVRPADGWNIKASLAKGFRNPSFRELYLYRTANDKLSPEKMMNYEASISKRFAQLLSVSLTAFYSHGDNLIHTVDMKNINTGSFTNKGIEASVTAQPAERLTLNASYSYLHTTLDNLTAAPRQQYCLAASWQPIERLSIEASARGVEGLYVSEENKEENYMLIGAKISYTALRGSNDTRLLELFTTLDNITDCNYTINNGYKMPGFTISGGAKVSF